MPSWVSFFIRAKVTWSPAPFEVSDLHLDDGIVVLADERGNVGAINDVVSEALGPELDGKGVVYANESGGHGRAPCWN
jgi:hypothetical protein